MKYTIAQFIPIILIFILLTYPYKLANFSQSILGKFIAVSMIIFYTHLDKIIGLFVCSLIIFYYQQDNVENMLNLDDEKKKEKEIDAQNKPFLSTTNNMHHMHTNDDVSIDDVPNDYINENMSESFTGSPIVQTDTDSGVMSSGGNTIYPKMYEELYNGNHTTGAHTNEIMDQFRKQNCDGRVLKYKNMSVKTDMVEHVFPELKFNGSVCNPCDSKCNYSIIESKLKTETEMIPKSST